MALFEEIGRRIANAGQGVAQQTKNLTDTTRLNAKITENKKKMSQLLFEMGNDYYKKHRREQDCEEQMYIDQINSLFNEVVKWEDEIEAIKASEICKACGFRVPKGASSCTNCGARLGVDDFADEYEDDSRVCPTCGAAVDNDSVFCSSCGAKIEVQLEDPADDGYQYNTEEPIRTCPVCGAEVEDGDMFCMTCGKKL